MKKYIKISAIIISILFFLGLIETVIENKNEKNSWNYPIFKEKTTMESSIFLSLEEADAKLKVENLKGKTTKNIVIAGSAFTKFKETFNDKENIEVDVLDDVDYIKTHIFELHKNSTQTEKLKGNHFILNKENNYEFDVRNNQFELSKKSIEKVEELINTNRNFERNKYTSTEKKLKKGNKWSESHSRFKYLGIYADNFKGDIDYQVKEIKKIEGDKIAIIGYTAYLIADESNFNETRKLELNLKGEIHYSIEKQTDIKAIGEGKYRYYLYYADFLKGSFSLKGIGKCILDYQTIFK